jgi:hypothetical protein
MPNIPFWLVVIAAILIVYGRMTTRNPVAIAGFVVLPLAGLLALLTR